MIWNPQAQTRNERAHNKEIHGVIFSPSITILFEGLMLSRRAQRIGFVIL